MGLERRGESGEESGGKEKGGKEREGNWRGDAKHPRWKISSYATVPALNLLPSSPLDSSVASFFQSQ